MLHLHLISFFQIGATRNRNLHATTVFASTRNFNVTETQIVEMPQMRSLVGLHVSANFCVTQHQLVSCACFIMTGNSAACGLFPVILKQAHDRSANSQYCPISGERILVEQMCHLLLNGSRVRAMFE